MFVPCHFSVFCCQCILSTSWIFKFCQLRFQFLFRFCSVCSIFRAFSHFSHSLHSSHVRRTRSTHPLCKNNEKTPIFIAGIGRSAQAHSKYSDYSNNMGFDDLSASDLLLENLQINVNKKPCTQQP